MVVSVAIAAERLVVTKIDEAAIALILEDMETVEQPLKPNQANQRMNTPKAPRVKL